MTTLASSLRPHGRTRGLSLIEVMVSLGLAAIVSVAAVSLTGVYAASFSAQLSLSDAQESLWAGNELIARELRKAGNGFGFCPNGLLHMWRVVDYDDPPVGTTEVDRTGTFIPPYFNTATAQTKGSFYSTETAAVPPVFVINNMYGTNPAGPDMLDIFYGEDASLSADTTVTSAHGVTATEFKVNTTTGFSPGDVFIVWSNSSGSVPCTLFKTTSTVTDLAANTLKHAYVAATKWNPDPAGDAADLAKFYPSGGYSGGSTTMVTRLGSTLQRVRFYISTNGTTWPPTFDPNADNPQLIIDRFDGTGETRNPQVVADGIEDFQVAYACDGAGSTTTGEVVEASTNVLKANRTVDDYYVNIEGDVAGASPGVGNPRCYDQATGGPRIALVRFTITARTRGQTGGNLPGRPRAEDRPGVDITDGGVSDGYRRRTQTTEVSLRN